MKCIMYTKSTILLLVGSIILCSFNHTSESTLAASYFGKRDTLPCFLVISDIHLQNNKQQKEIPDNEANTGSNLWQEAQKEIKKIDSINKPKFIIVLGDLGWHASSAKPDEVASAMHNAGIVLKDLRNLSQKAGIPLLFIPGNNDSYSGDYKPFSKKLFNKDSIGKACWPLIDSDFPLSQNPLRGDTSKLNLGCYSAYPLGEHKLRVIVLNSTIFSSHVGYGPSKNADADTAINWLRTQLKDAKKEHVLIAMHIPPGIDVYNDTCLWCDKLKYDDNRSVQNVFLDIIDSFKTNIVGILSGHTHMDGIRLLVNDNKPDNSKISALLISVPGIAPGHGNNPGIKLIHYNPYNKNDSQNSYALQDFITYYMPYWNKDPKESIKSWADSFNCRTAFHLPYQGNSLLNDIKTLPPDLLRKYVDSIYTVHGKNDTDVTKSHTNREINSSVYVVKLK